MSNYALVTGTGASRIQGIAIDDTNVYWADSGKGTINSVPKGGGATITLATGQSGPMRLAVDDTYLYWSNNLGAAIMMTSKDGSGTPTMLAVAGEPLGIAVDATDVYWTNQLDNSVMKIAKSGGGMAGMQLATVAAVTTSIVVDATDVYFIMAQSGTASGALYRVAKSGGPATQFAQGDAYYQNVSAVALDDSYVYWVDVDANGAGGGAVHRMMKAGGADDVLANIQQEPLAIDTLATDGCSLYVWDSPMAPMLMQMSVWGGPMTTAGVPGYFLAIDSSYTYAVWNNAIYRSPR